MSGRELKMSNVKITAIDEAFIYPNLKEVAYEVRYHHQNGKMQGLQYLRCILS